jgi:hypothetical protein
MVQATAYLTNLAGSFLSRISRISLGVGGYGVGSGVGVGVGDGGGGSTSLKTVKLSIIALVLELTDPFGVRPPFGVRRLVAALE